MVIQKCSYLPKVIQVNRTHHSFPMKRNLTMGNNLTGSFSLEHIICSSRLYSKYLNYIITLLESLKYLLTNIN